MGITMQLYNTQLAFLLFICLQVLHSGTCLIRDRYTPVLFLFGILSTGICVLYFNFSNPTTFSYPSECPIRQVPCIHSSSSSSIYNMCVYVIPLRICAICAIATLMASMDGELLSNGEIPPEFTTRSRMLEKLVSTPGANLHVDALLVSGMRHFIYILLFVL